MGFSKARETLISMRQYVEFAEALLRSTNATLTVPLRGWSHRFLRQDDGLPHFACTSGVATYIS